jgi:hypothetical protein
LIFCADKILAYHADDNYVSCALVVVVNRNLFENVSRWAKYCRTQRELRIVEDSSGKIVAKMKLNVGGQYIRGGSFLGTSLVVLDIVEFKKIGYTNHIGIWNYKTNDFHIYYNKGQALDDPIVNVDNTVTYALRIMNGRGLFLYNLETNSEKRLCRSEDMIIYDAVFGKDCVMAFGNKQTTGHPRYILYYDILKDSVSTIPLENRDFVLSSISVSPSGEYMAGVKNDVKLVVLNMNFAVVWSKKLSSEQILKCLERRYVTSAPQWNNGDSSLFFLEKEYKLTNLGIFGNWEL